MKSAAILILAAACTARPAPHREPSPAPGPRQPAVALGPSIYDLTVPLTDAAGHQLGLDADRGHPTLISMFYGSCASACPVLVDEIGRTVAALPPSKQADVRVLLVSFDAARDTPARLGELAQLHHLDDRWTLASAGDEDARTLAAVLGIRYRPVPGGQFSHTSVVVALDGEGQPIARLDGLGDPAPLVAALSD